MIADILILLAVLIFIIAAAVAYGRSKVFDFIAIGLALLAASVYLARGAF